MKRQKANNTWKSIVPHTQGFVTGVIAVLVVNTLGKSETDNSQIIMYGTPVRCIWPNVCKMQCFFLRGVNGRNSENMQLT